MILSDYAGEAILGRHPEHGFLLDGQIHRDVADLLCQRGFRLVRQHGFQSEGDDVLALPADLDETAARKMIDSTAQALAMAGHNVTVLSDQAAADLVAGTPRPDAALAALGLRTALADLRTRLLGLIRSVHPAPRCLPVPLIEVPSGREQYDPAITALAGNLFTAQSHNAPRWLAAHHECPHLPTDTVLAINEVIYRWYQVLLAARWHIDDEPEFTLYTLDEATARLAAAMTAVPPAPNRDQIIQPATVGELHDGDEFSLDTGHTWHVCATVLFGTVSVYTGEHDATGQPQCHRIRAASAQHCLARRAVA